MKNRKQLRKVPELCKSQVGLHKSTRFLNAFLFFLSTIVLFQKHNGCNVELWYLHRFFYITGTVLLLCVWNVFFPKRIMGKPHSISLTCTMAKYRLFDVMLTRTWQHEIKGKHYFFHLLNDVVEARHACTQTYTDNSLPFWKCFIWLKILHFTAHDLPAFSVAFWWLCWIPPHQSLMHMQQKKKHKTRHVTWMQYFAAPWQIPWKKTTQPK